MKLNLRNKSRELRVQGWSVRSIAKELGVAKSSVSTWVRDILLTEEQLSQLKSNAVANREKFASRFATGNNQQHVQSVKRMEVFKQSGSMLAQTDVDFRVLCALYWGEGAKCKNEFRITNADFRFLQVVMKWLRNNGYYNKVTFRVSYHPGNGLTENDLKLWWQRMLNLDVCHFRKFIPYKPREGVWRGKQKGKMPYGVGAISVCSTQLRQLVEGGIEYLYAGV